MRVIFRMVKKIIIIFVFGFLFLFQAPSSYAATGIYRIDFGDFNNRTLTTGWNNMTPTQGTTPLSLIETDGTASSVTATMDRVISAVNLVGTTASSLYPSTATSDTIYISRTGFFSSPQAYTITLGGLTEGHTYDIRLFGSRITVSDVRTVNYTIPGQTTLTHDAANNVNNYVTFEDVEPNVSGQIGIGMTHGTGNTSTDGFGYLGVMEIFDNGATADVTDPIISAVASDPAATTASITWTTDESSNSSVEYGLTTGYGSTTTGNSNATSHTVSLTGLTAATTYHYRVSSTDGSNNTATSTDYTFTTDAVNGDPVASAGVDQTITLPTHSVTVSGTGSTDSDGTIVSYLWEETTSTGAYILSSTAPTTVVSDLAFGTTTLRLTVTDDDGGTAVDTMTITINKSNNTTAGKKIVVLGSSTAAGTGASPSSNSWVNLFAAYLEELNPANEVVNLAVGGYTTTSVLPVASGGVVGHNIEEAIAQDPDGILVNLPSNDIGNNIFPTTTMANYATIVALADAQGIPIWISTSQPRNYGIQGQRDALVTVKNSTISTYPDTYLDFWTRIAVGPSDGFMVATYNQGDGIHLNNAGHRILYNRTVGSGFVESLFPPVVSSVVATTANTSTDITWTTDEIASSRVQYGLTTSYGSTTSEQNTSPRVTSHDVEITGLVSCTTYHYRVVSIDGYENTVTGSDDTFTTDGCTASSEVLSESSESITYTAGGTAELMSGGDGISLDIPSDATNADAVYQIKLLDGDDVIGTLGLPNGLEYSAEHIYDLKALTGVGTSVTSFDEPIDITITYDDSDITGMEESSLVIYRYSGGSWHSLAPCTVDTTANTVTCSTTGFSVFGLFGTESAGTIVAATSSGSSNSGQVSGVSTGCSNQKPTNAPDLFQINSERTTATLFFSPTGGSTSKYVVSFGENQLALQYGAEFNVSNDNKGVQKMEIGYLKPNTTYFYMIRGGNGCATGEWSNKLAAKTTTNNTKKLYYRSGSEMTVPAINAEIVQPNSASIKPEPTTKSVNENKVSPTKKVPQPVETTPQPTVQSKEKKCFWFICW
ncbi:MAG: fibronectin type III domain-containing protein [Weeksellaceae bacterium]